MSFAKSKRIDHFKPKKYYEDYPSAASYGSDVVAEKIGDGGRLKSSGGGKKGLLARLCEEVMGCEIKGVTIPK